MAVASNGRVNVRQVTMIHSSCSVQSTRTYEKCSLCIKNEMLIGIDSDKNKIAWLFFFFFKLEAKTHTKKKMRWTNEKLFNKTSTMSKNWTEMTWLTLYFDQKLSELGIYALSLNRFKEKGKIKTVNIYFDMTFVASHLCGLSKVRVCAFFLSFVSCCTFFPDDSFIAFCLCHSDLSMLLA